MFGRTFPFFILQLINVITTVISPINIKKCFTEFTSLSLFLPVWPVPMKTDPDTNYTKRDHFDELQIHYYREKSLNKECCLCLVLVTKDIRIFTFYWPFFFYMYAQELSRHVSLTCLSLPVTQWSECAFARDRTSFTKSCFVIQIF